MDAQQFATFINNMTNLINGQAALTTAITNQPAQPQQPNASNNTLKISLKIPNYRDESNENTLI